MLRVVTVLRGHPEGIRPAEIARRVGVATRTVYRDLRALEEEVGVAVWSEGGLWGVVGEEFLPPLKLTLDEAMAVVLSARLMVRYADKYDPDLAAAFEKLEAVLPRPLAEHVERTLDVLAQHPRDEAFSEHVHRLTRAWAERRVVTLDYEPAALRGPMPPPAQAVVRPYLIEPSLQTHALYLIGWDETRDALRTFKIERIRDVALTPADLRAARGRRRRGDPPAAPGTSSRTSHRRPIVLRFSPTVATRVQEATWHRQPARPARAGWLADVARDGRRDHRDPPLDPVLGRRRGGARATRRCEPTWRRRWPGPWLATRPDGPTAWDARVDRCGQVGLG